MNNPGNGQDSTVFRYGPDPMAAQWLPFCLLDRMYALDVATCPGSFIVHADGTIAACSEDEEASGCRGREARHEGDPIRR